MQPRAGNHLKARWHSGASPHDGTTPVPLAKEVMAGVVTVAAILRQRRQQLCGVPIDIAHQEREHGAALDQALAADLLKSLSAVGNDRGGGVVW